jgi:hypothetical protein
MAGENNPVIGRKPTTAPTPPLGTGTVLLPKPSAVIPGGLGSAIDTGLGNVNVKVVKSEEIDKSDFVTNLTKAEMKRILPWLKKFGGTKTQLSTYPNAKKYLQTDFDTLVGAAEGNVNKLISLFESQATGFGGADGADTGPKSNGVTQYITKQAPELIAKDVDKFLLTTIGSENINQESRDKIMAEINKMIEAGTTTTSKMDKKTGKTTVTQTSGYSEERAGEVVERIAKEAEPLKYEQQRQATFYDFIQSADQMRGGR